MAYLKERGAFNAHGVSMPRQISRRRDASLLCSERLPKACSIQHITAQQSRLPQAACRGDISSIFIELVVEGRRSFRHFRH